MARVYVAPPDPHHLRTVTGGVAPSEFRALQEQVQAKVESSTVTAVVALAQAEYDVLTPDPTTLYVIVG